MTHYPSPAKSFIQAVLTGAGGFTPPDKTLHDLSAEDANFRLPASPHTIAEIIAHLNYWQTWTLNVVQGEPRLLPEHAADGWPAPQDWTALKQNFLTGLQTAFDLCEDEALLTRAFSPDVSIGASFDKHTVGSALSEVIALHNAYHLGQVVLLRRMMNDWPPEGAGVTW